MKKVEEFVNVPFYTNEIINQQPIILYLIKFIIELFGFLFCLSVVLYSIISFPPWWSYGVYLTYWTLTNTTVTFFLCTLCSLERIIRRIIYKFTKKNYLVMDYISGILEFIRTRYYMLSVVESIYVAFAFWLLVYQPGQEIYFSSVGAHAISAILILIEFLLSTVYIYWWDFFVVFGYCTAYCLFGVFHYYARGFWVYSVLDPNTNKQYWIVYLMSYLVLLGLFFLFKFCSFIRNKIIITLCYKKYKKEEDPIYKTEKENYYYNILISLTFILLTIIYCFILNLMFLFINNIEHQWIGNLIYELLFLSFEIIILSIGYIGILFYYKNIFISNILTSLYLILSIIISIFVIFRFIISSSYIGQNISNKISAYYYVTMGSCIFIYIHLLISWIVIIRFKVIK